MATFAETSGAVPFGFYSDETDFQVEADKVHLFVHRHLGADILQVELSKRQVWSCFEQACLEYSAIINTHQARNQLMSLLGQPTGSLSGSQQLFIHETLSFLERAAEPYSYLAGVGGPYNYVMGSIDLVSGQQDYDLTTDLKDTAGTPIYDLQPSASKTQLRVIEVLHFSPASAYRFFDSTSAINYLNNEFSFESFTPETIFYVLPVFEDILRAQQFEISQKVRRSIYSFDIIGNKLRIYPTPVSMQLPRKLWVKVAPVPDPTMRTTLSGTLGASLSYTDSSVYGVSNVANLPYGNIPYTDINSVGRQWIRQYTLALAKELLGLIRSKFTTIPIPNSDLTLNGEALVSQGREDKDKLVTSLTEMLASLTYDQLLVREAEKATALQTVLRGVPVPPGWSIVLG